MAFSAEFLNPQEDLFSALSALHVGGKYSDLTVLCNYKQWAIHKAIVCSRSAFFDGACSNGFREANGVIDLSEDDQDAVEQMIHFFYHLDYLNDDPQQQRSALFRHRAHSDARKRLPKKLDLSTIEDPLLAQAGAYAPQLPDTPPASATSDGHGHFEFPDKPRSPTLRTRTPPLDDDDGSDTEMSDYDEEFSEPESHLLLHTRVYALAEKYDIPSLKTVARNKFETAMACYYDAPEFPDAIEEVYCSTIDTDRGLRDVVLQAFTVHPQLLHMQDVSAVIEDTPTLALELFKLERGIPI